MARRKTKLTTASQLLEPLESRQMLDGLPWTLPGTMGDDEFLVEPSIREGIDWVSVSLNGSLLDEKPLSEVSELIIYAWDPVIAGNRPAENENWDGDFNTNNDHYGDDTLIIGSGDVDDLPRITFDGGDPQDVLVEGLVDGGIDRVIINDFSHSASTVWDDVGIDMIHRNGFETSATLASSDEITLKTGTGSDELFIDEIRVSLDVETGTGADIVDVFGYHGSLDLGDGNDVLRIQGYINVDDLPTVNGVFSGGNGDDAFLLGYYSVASPSGGPSLDGISDVTLIDGVGNNSLELDDRGAYGNSHRAYWTQGNDFQVGASTSALSIEIEYDDFDATAISLRMQTTTTASAPELQVVGSQMGMPLTVYPGEMDDELKVDQNLSNTLAGEPVHIKPSLGHDHVIVGNNGTNPATVIFDPEFTEASITYKPNIGALDIKSNGTARLAVGQYHSLKMTSLSIVSGGVFDLSNAAAIIDYTGSSPLLATGGTYDRVKDAYNGGAWNGTGINSSSIVDNTTAIGYAEATGLGSPASFAGQSIDSTSILLKYTYCADANLDGKVDISDLSRYFQNIFQSNRYWWQADFTFDGVVNQSDQALITRTWQMGVGNPL